MSDVRQSDLRHRQTFEIKEELDQRDKSDQPFTHIPEDQLPHSQNHVRPRASRANLEPLHLAALIPPEHVDLKTFGLEESRDGYFDASFYHPDLPGPSYMCHEFQDRFFPPERTTRPLSIYHFIPHQLHSAKTTLKSLRRGHGVKLLKSFLSVYLAYVTCLVPATRSWLGPYCYILVISATVNHSGRSVGSQIDGIVLTIIGVVAGLSWGSLALFVSVTTAQAKLTYGVILACFLVLFAAFIGYLRCVFLRLYQAVISAGIAICYVTLANTSQQVGWHKVFDFGIPWILGQILTLAVAVLVFPTAGSRACSIAFHDCLLALEAGLNFPRQGEAELKQKLLLSVVNLSTAIRDFALECTYSPYNYDRNREMRNSLQQSIRNVINIRSNASMFGHSCQTKVELDIAAKLSQPTSTLLSAMKLCISASKESVLQLSFPHLFSPPSRGIAEALHGLENAMKKFDTADADLLEQEDLSTAYKEDPAAIELFLFVHPIRQTADTLCTFVSCLKTVQEASSWWRFRLPSYPWRQAINRSNAQVRHDRGGLTAGFFFKSKQELEKSMAHLLNNTFVPNHPDDIFGHARSKETVNKHHKSVRYKLWQYVHKLQGFESRFALKVTLVTTLLALPAWLPQSREWWNAYESWWACVTVWLMMHPRVGGTFHDLFTRCVFAIIGATWAAIGVRVGNGNPYAMAAFAAMYLIPMLYRFSQSNHPRSGLVGCISFVVISLDSNSSRPGMLLTVAWTRGLAFLVGIVAAVIVNWILWPFVARHELRKSLAAMLLYLGITYRGVIAKYVYYTADERPSDADVENSEILEGKLREGFVRLRQLLELTSHEIRLRGPFQPLPYNALITISEDLFGHIVQVRQSSLYFRKDTMSPDADAMQQLIGPRRDAVAVILMNLHTFSTSLRLSRALPRYLPDAAVARSRLVNRIDALEAQQLAQLQAEELARKLTGNLTAPTKRRWADVYHYAFSNALTDIVDDLKCLHFLVREICGETNWE